MKKTALTPDEIAKAAVKSAKLFVIQITKNLGRKAYEYRATVGFATPEGLVLASKRKASRDQKHLAAWIDEQKKAKLSYKMQTGFDRDTTALDEAPRVEYLMTIDQK